MRRKSYFGSEVRAAAGCIVTFELEDDSVVVEHFNQLIGLRKRGTKSTPRIGTPYIEQAAARADELGAKIITISTPQTILTDLQGTRAPLEAKPTGVDGLKGGMQQAPTNYVAHPELRMLGRIGRTDLFKPPSGQAIHNIKQVRARRTRNRSLGGI
jgi:hypothetical protein